MLEYVLLFIPELWNVYDPTPFFLNLLYMVSLGKINLGLAPEFFKVSDSLSSAMEKRRGVI
ncbi:hypothetical protein K3W81_14900, partial [Listeria monocytogenes]|nr:hypothetical protein [Listeria monocytogenes]